MVRLASAEITINKLLWKSRGMPPGKSLKSGHLRVHFQHSGAKIRVFEQNTDSIKFWLFWELFPKKRRRRVHMKYPANLAGRRSY